MPRQARLDAPGALHHLIIRGIAGEAIFRDPQDRAEFLQRLGAVLTETATPCYAWALMSNHVHILARTGLTPMATVMRRLLTGYAQYFNRRHRRRGHLFQNRYQSILCEEDPYLLELVRYIHLNPLRAGVVQDLNELASYPYTGHRVLNGRGEFPWQDRDFVLRLFGSSEGEAVAAYNAFVAQGAAAGQPPDPIGGRTRLPAGSRNARPVRQEKGMPARGYGRVLGSSDFLARLLQAADEHLSWEQTYTRRGLDLETLIQRTAEHFGVTPEALASPGKEPSLAAARAAVCYLAVRKLRLPGAAVAARLHISPSAVSKAAQRGQTPAAESLMKELCRES